MSSTNSPSTDFEAVIGLETHVQLKTKSKMWCGCANEFGAPPNSRVCPVCLGLPGVLPVANEEALQLTVLTGLLLNCEIPSFAKFDRKNYFYPDMPKNYQITQYDKPSTRNGWLDFEFQGRLARVRITRAHLEEDVGKNSHFDRHSGVDFNRAGVPLLEIVSEPDISGADMAYEYLNALKEVLIYGGVSDADMEKGMVRCDVNVSVRPRGATELGKKIEIKNMNSFSGARRALEYEIPRQIGVLTSGGQLRQETRRWDDDGRHHRTDALQGNGPRLPLFPRSRPHALRACARLAGASPPPRGRACPWPRSSASCAISNSPPPTPRPLSGTCRWETTSRRWPANPRTPRPSPTGSSTTFARKLAETQTALGDLKFKPEHILELIALVDAKTISSSIAQQVFAEMFDSGRVPPRHCRTERPGPGQRHRRHRGLLRPGHRRQSRPGRRFQIRQSRRPEFPQGPGDETEQRQGQPGPGRRNPPGQTALSGPEDFCIPLNKLAVEQ